jgi:hypothetical protein
MNIIFMAPIAAVTIFMIILFTNITSEEYCNGIPRAYGSFV